MSRYLSFLVDEAMGADSLALGRSAVVAGKLSPILNRTASIEAANRRAPGPTECPVVVPPPTTATCVDKVDERPWLSFRRWTGPP